MSRWCAVLAAVCLGLFATGVGTRPDGAAWALAYDVVLYNAVYVLAAVGCFAAAAHRPDGRLTWLAMGSGLVLSTSGNLVYSLVIARMPEEPYPSVADALYLAAFAPTCLGLVAFVRSRVPHLRPAMALDGLVGALGATGIAATMLLGPDTWTLDGDPAAALVGLT